MTTEQIRELLQSGLSCPKVAQRLGTPYWAVRKVYIQLSEEGSPVKSGKLVVNQRQPGEVDEDLWESTMEENGIEDQDPEELLETAAKLSHQLRHTIIIPESYGEMLLPFRVPVALAFTGDWHFGSAGVDYERLYYDVQQLADAIQAGLPIVVFGMGDYGDNYKASGRASEGLYDALLTNPVVQERGWVHLLRKLMPNILGLTLGCHLDWDFRISGRNVLAHIIPQLGDHSIFAEGVLDMSYGGVVALRLGTELYTGLVRHRLYGESQLNTTNAQRKGIGEYPVQDHRLDFAALGHRHFNDLQQTTVAGKQRVYLRSGGYKVWDRYGQRVGGYVAEPGIPLIILYPNEHKMVPFHGSLLTEGLQFLHTEVQRW